MPENKKKEKKKAESKQPTKPEIEVEDTDEPIKMPSEKQIYENKKPEDKKEKQDKKPREEEKKISEKESSIIGIIQEMVSKGEKEETIIQTLTDLGIDPEQAKRLLLIGQSDTFALLKSEIAKIVHESLEKEKPKLVEYLSEQSKIMSEKNAAEMSEKMKEDLEKYQETITGQSEEFQEKVNDTVTKVSELNDRVRVKLNELGEQVSKIRVDLDEQKVSGVGSRNRIISIILLIIGLAFLVMDLYFFFINLQSVITIDSVILTVIYGFIGMSLLFLATQI